MRPEERGRPLLGWLLPDPHAPEPGRLVRISPRGPLRVLALALSTLLVASVAGSAALAAAAAPVPVKAVVAAIAAIAIVAVSRAWAIGTYVGDTGYAVRGLVRSRRGRWREVERVDDTGGRATLALRDGTRVRTHVTARGLDFLGRPEAYDMARSRLRRWHADASG